MRAIFFKNSELDKVEIGFNFDISDGQIHHLKNVIRIEIGETVLGLNGAGLEAKLICTGISKKNITFSLLERKNHKKVPGVSAAIGILKKDAMEEILRLSVELGIDTLFFLKTKFSQRGLSLEEFSGRYQRVMESSLLQSNNFFFPKLVGPLDLASFFNATEKKHVFFYNVGNFPTQWLNKSLPPKKKNYENIVLVVGPEGGFSHEEETLFQNKENVFAFKFDTPILRTQNALAVSRGHLIGIYWEKN